MKNPLMTYLRNKIRLTFVILNVLYANLSFPQTPIIISQNTIGGGISDYCQVLIPCNENGFLICGNSISESGFDKTQDAYEESEDFWIVRVDSNLNILWDKTLGGNQDDNLTCGLKIPSGFIIGGYSNSVISGDKTENPVGDPYSSDYWIMQINEFGEIVWQNTIGGASGEGLKDIYPAPDGGYILVGHSSSPSSGDKIEPILGEPYTADFWIVKIDSIGNLLWQNTIGGDYNDIPKRAILTNDNSIIIAGMSNSTVSVDKTDAHYGPLIYYDLWLVKLDSLGNVEWAKTIGTIEDDRLDDMKLTCDGGFILLSTTASGISYDKTTMNYGSSDYWVLKYDNEANLMWQNSYGGSGADIAHSISQNTDGTYLIGGSSYSGVSGIKSDSSRGYTDYWIIKIDQLGNFIWDKTIGGITSDEIVSVQVYVDDIIAVGSSNSNISGEKTENSKGGDVFTYMDYWVLSLTVDSLLNIEVCNNLDDNCNGLIDEDIPLNILYQDFDNDGFGNYLIDTLVCFFGIDGYVSDSTDCNDSDPEVFPEQIEIFNGIDDNCNELVDEGLTIISETSNKQYDVTPSITSDKLIINYKNEKCQNPLVSICNIFGVEVYKTIIVNTTTIIELGNLSSGPYFVNLFCDYSLIDSVRIIKQ
jgi:hypothetical protein